jgi:hypothetical protein
MHDSNLLDRQKNEPEDWYSRGRIIITSVSDFNISSKINNITHR